MNQRASIKILQSQGFGSRKACENIFQNFITEVNGQPFDPNLQQLNYGDSIKFNDETYLLQKNIYLLMNKPAGFETSHKPSHHPSVFKFLPSHFINRGIQAIGRLDVDTTGVLLFSDDGQFIHRLISGNKSKKQAVQKEYLITCSNPITIELTDKLLDGVLLEDENEPVFAELILKKSAHDLIMVINTGKYHQVKRMIAAAGNHVAKLHRNRVGPYSLPNALEPGQFVDIQPLP